MKKLKTQKGITLIALIITIVVLLILAVVSIGAVQDSNIVGYAQNAAGGYDKAKGNENNTISGYENILSQYANGGNSIGNAGGDNSSGGSNASIGNLGKYVKYDSNGDGSVEDETILWRVLRDDADRVELITADTLGNVYLMPTSFEDARNKYNGAIESIITECKRVTGIEDNIRSVGGPTLDETSETIDFKELAQTEKFNPTVNIENFAQYEEQNGLKIGDNNYEEDKNQMQISGVAQSDNTAVYWLASREVVISGTQQLFFGVRYGYGGYSCTSLGNVRNDGKAFGHSTGNDTFYSLGVRPVLTLEGGILEGKTGEGTKTQPIEIY